MTALHSIRWKLTLTYLLTIFAAILIPGLILSRWIDTNYEASLRNDLISEAKLIGRLSEITIKTDPKSLDKLAKESGMRLGKRITIINNNGTVLADSLSDTSKMENHSDRREIVDALSKGTGYDIRLSDTLKTNMLYAAVRFGSEAYNNIGVARISEDLAIIKDAKDTLHQVFLIAGLFSLLIALIISFILSKNIVNPIQEMSRIAEKYARGELTHKLGIRNIPGDEIDNLANALNTMSLELHHNMQELSSEKSKLQSILDKTDDGLLVVDNESKIRMANPAASRILGTGNRNINGMTIIECTLSIDLAEMVERVFRTKQPASLEVQLLNPPQVYLNVYTAAIELPEGITGAIVVMHDITESKVMDSIRRDFVANVSHELRTPLASIRAMAETISLRGRKNPAMTEEFASKIINEADRLVAISDDLLDLSKIEAGRRSTGAEIFPLTEIVESVQSQLSQKASSKSIEINVDVSNDIRVRADKDSVHQILTNLIDNAIKYTPVGGKILISALYDENVVKVSIADTGVGIPQSDLPRIFERFYRVDKARSRESGGTGLGLSIVKHLVEGHGGTITVNSILNRGSVFTFTLTPGDLSNT